MVLYNRICLEGCHQEDTVLLLAANFIATDQMACSVLTSVPKKTGIPKSEIIASINLQAILLEGRDGDLPFHSINHLRVSQSRNCESAGLGRACHGYMHMALLKDGIRLDQNLIWDAGFFVDGFTLLCIPPLSNPNLVI